jgi:molybdopterin-guanine dinucleotide biosynthesis protein A
MGEDKAKLVLGGTTLLERLLAVLEEIFPRVALVVGEERDSPPEGREILRDTVAGQGPIGGVAAALRWCATEYCFVTACDMPFPDPALIRLVAGAPEALLVVPESGGRIHPLHARYARGMLGRVEAAILAGQRRMGALFSDSWGTSIPEAVMRLHGIDAERALMNLNTPDELRRARSLSGEGPH